MYEKIVVVTRKTRLEELIERFCSRGQARFYIEHAGGDFSDFEREDEAYRQARDVLERTLQLGLKLQFVERHFLPTFMFTEKDMIVTLGGNGLVVNAAKYSGRQPILAVNPDPQRFATILVPYTAAEAAGAVRLAIESKAVERRITLAEASLQDGQRMLAFNDLFIGARTHVSARYRLSFGDRTERQSSSGIIVSTGAGSSGWLSSVFNMASAISTFTGGRQGQPPQLPWEDPRLMFVVREPFVNQMARADTVAGLVYAGHELRVESLMPSEGAIFSDGIESDFVSFNAGATVTVQPAAQQARLIWKNSARQAVRRRAA